jgi:hypothetical protein
MADYKRVTVPVVGNDGKTRFRAVGVCFPGKPGDKSAGRVILDFPVGVTEFVLFDPKDALADED